MLGCSVREAQNRIDSQEFAEWYAVAKLQTLGDRNEWATARVGAVMAAAHGGKMDETWFLWDAPPRKRKTGREMEMIFRQFAAVHNKQCQQQSPK